MCKTKGKLFCNINIFLKWSLPKYSSWILDTMNHNQIITQKGKYLDCISYVLRWSYFKVFGEQNEGFIETVYAIELIWTLLEQKILIFFIAMCSMYSFYFMTGWTISQYLWVYRDKRWFIFMVHYLYFFYITLSSWQDNYQIGLPSSIPTWCFLFLPTTFGKPAPIEQVSIFGKSCCTLRNKPILLNEGF